MSEYPNWYVTPKLNKKYMITLKGMITLFHVEEHSPF